MYGYRLILSAVLLALPLGVLTAQDPSGIEPEALIERVLAVDKAQREQLRDVTFDAEYIEREESDEGPKEKIRLEKKVYIKYLNDTAWYAEEYLAFYEEGRQKSENDLKNEAAERTEKKKKRKAQDISYPMLKPFYSIARPLYDIQYLGVADERIENRICHHFTVTAKIPEDSLVNGHYYFEAENFHLVRVDFTPSKPVRKMMFKLKTLDMSILYGPGPDEIWLPKQFDIRGKGKAALFIGVNFAGTEYYRNPQINTGLPESLFEAGHDD
ncbi:MAG: hypothetical protein AB1772_05915 [Candidatus Zixiibacteriota bacterium]